ncbi:MAG: class I SAM-dependent methyltransferase [Saprospiraceae bacterium]|nr:class I SAM-dependent methyltransferase [Saprospiraceae bacterium]
MKDPKISEDYIRINRDSWNKRTERHFESLFYDNASFLEGRSSLNDIELSLLGDITGKKILHLQCHFGQDSISLARLGAQVTGVDLSGNAIEKARALSKAAGTSCRFIESDIYELPAKLDEQFDIVFTSYGTIGWLPDINKWAGVVERFTKKNGWIIMAEFHPFVWMFDDDFKTISYRYFNDKPIIESEEGSYTENSKSDTYASVTWNHGLAEVLQALVDREFDLEVIREYDYSPYNCFKGTVEVKKGKYRIEKLGDRIPMVYALKMCKST